MQTDNACAIINTEDAHENGSQQITKEFEMDRNGVTLKNAIKTFNHYGKERERVHNWMPDRWTREELSEAVEVLKISKRAASKLLNKAGYALFETELYW